MTRPSTPSPASFPPIFTPPPAPRRRQSNNGYNVNPSFPRKRRYSASSSCGMQPIYEWEEDLTVDAMAVEDDDFYGYNMGCEANDEDEMELDQEHEDQMIGLTMRMEGVEQKHHHFQHRHQHQPGEHAYTPIPRTARLSSTNLPSSPPQLAAVPINNTTTPMDLDIFMDSAPHTVPHKSRLSRAASSLSSSPIAPPPDVCFPMNEPTHYPRKIPRHQHQEQQTTPLRGHIRAPTPMFCATRVYSSTIVSHSSPPASGSCTIYHSSGTFARSPLPGSGSNKRARDLVDDDRKQGMKEMEQNHMKRIKMAADTIHRI